MKGGGGVLLIVFGLALGYLALNRKLCCFSCFFACVFAGPGKGCNCTGEGSGGGTGAITGGGGGPIVVPPSNVSNLLRPLELGAATSPYNNALLAGLTNYGAR